MVVLPRPWLCYQGNGRIPSGCVTTPLVVLPGEGALLLFIAIYLFDVPVAMCDERIMWIPAGGLCYP